MKSRHKRMDKNENRLANWALVTLISVCTVSSLYGNETDTYENRTDGGTSENITFANDMEPQGELPKTSRFYKIHGKDWDKCTPYESLGNKEDAVKNAHLAAFAYQDDVGLYKPKDENGNKSKTKIKRSEAFKETEYTPLSADATRELLKGSGLQVVEKDGMVTIVSPNDKSSNKVRFNATLLKDEAGNIVIAYRGTTMTEARDWWDDAVQALNTKGVAGMPDQYVQAKNLLEAVLQNTDSNTQIVCTGHSLGGGLLTYAMASIDLQDRVTGWTYNPAGLCRSVADELMNNPDLVKKAADKITNIRMDLDPVSFVGYHLGEMYEIKSRPISEKHGMPSMMEHMMNFVGNNGENDDPFNTQPEPSYNGDNTDDIPPDQQGYQGLKPIKLL